MSDHPAITLPASIAPDANPGGYMVHGYNLDEGRLVFSIMMADMAQGLDVPPTTGLLLVVYDGDDGTMMQATVARPNGSGGAAVVPLMMGAGAGAGLDMERVHDLAKTVAITRLEAKLDKCTGDPDKLCPICDDDVPDGATVKPADCHRECQLAYTIGWYGHLTDCKFWCENMDDPLGGIPVRESALRVAALVAEHGIRAVIDGTFKKDENAT